MFSDLKSIFLGGTLLDALLLFDCCGCSCLRFGIEFTVGVSSCCRAWECFGGVCTNCSASISPLPSSTTTEGESCRWYTWRSRAAFCSARRSATNNSWKRTQMQKARFKTRGVSKQKNIGAKQMWLTCSADFSWFFLTCMQKGIDWENKSANDPTEPLCSDLIWLQTKMKCTRTW